jgi:hypothetical protein
MPKVGTALEIWRRWPTEIEVDLLDRNLDIADWLQGTRDEHGRLKLSSRRLLVVLEKCKETSEYAKWALRNGDLTFEQDVARKSHNLLGKLTASYLSAHGVEGDAALYYPVESRAEYVQRWLDAEADFLENEADAEPDLIGSLFGG